MSPRRSAAEARDTRAAIVDRAVDLSSVEGLEGLTIGRLAAEMQMSKAGVIGHFGNKETLQLETLDAATRVFIREVWQPPAHLEPGLPRLLGVCDAWISYLDRGVFPGGCFLTAASTEFDGRPGPVHDAIAAALARWLDALAGEVRTAKRAGDLPRGTDPAGVAFQLNALAMGTNQAIQLHRDPRAGARGRATMRALLGASGARR